MTRSNPWMTGLGGIAVGLALTSLAMNISLWRAEKVYSNGANMLLAGNLDEAAADFHKAIQSGWSQPMFFAASALSQTLRSPRFALPPKPWEPIPVPPEPEQEELHEALSDAHRHSSYLQTMLASGQTGHG